MNFNKKNLGMLAVAIVAFVIVEGTGLTVPAKQFVGMLTTKVKGFVSGLFSKQQ